MGNARKCVICKRILIDEPDLVCSRCKKRGFRIAKKSGKYVAGAAVLVSPFLPKGIIGKKS